MKTLTHADISSLSLSLARAIMPYIQRHDGPYFNIYGIPRGGIPVALSLLAWFSTFQVFKTSGFPQVRLIDRPDGADMFVDDLVDSGRTRERMKKEYPCVPFLGLIEKGSTEGYPYGTWVTFPWEATTEGSTEDIFVRLLQYIGEDPTRGGLVDTPARMAKAWKDWTAGYSQDATSILKTFEDGAENYDELIHVRAIPFYSHCEHHLAPFFGTISFGYIPSEKNRIVGLSKMDRLAQVFARRLQVQERLTTQIIDAFCEVMEPRGAGIVVKARHLCMESRGVCHQGCETSTAAFRGVLKSEIAARAEFYSLTK